MEKDLQRFEVGIYTNHIIMKCPNFDVCFKTVKPGLKVCTSCFWRFKNEKLEFIENVECPMCSDVKKCVKFRKCTHYVCASVCFPRLDKCPMCG